MKGSPAFWIFFLSQLILVKGISSAVPAVSVQYSEWEVNEEVCECGSELLTVTQTFKGGHECLKPTLEDDGGGSAQTMRDLWKQQPGVSAKACAEIGWEATLPVFVRGGAKSGCGVAADQDFNGTCGHVSPSTFGSHADAASYCSSKGARLCELNEIERGVLAKPLTTAYTRVWTNTPCKCASQYYTVWAGGRSAMQADAATKRDNRVLEWHIDGEDASRTRVTVVFVLYDSNVDAADIRGGDLQNRIG